MRHHSGAIGTVTISTFLSIAFICVPNFNIFAQLIDAMLKLALVQIRGLDEWFLRRITVVEFAKPLSSWKFFTEVNSLFWRVIIFDVV